MENDERIRFFISRKIFVQSLETLLKAADLEVKELTYYFSDPEHLQGEKVKITFTNGHKKNVCIEADSRAAIIKDVLRACE